MTHRLREFGSMEKTHLSDFFRMNTEWKSRKARSKSYCASRKRIWKYGKNAYKNYCATI